MVSTALEENLMGSSGPIPDGRVIDLRKAIEAVREVAPFRVRGRVTEVTGLIIKAAVPGVRIGEMCWVTNPKDDDVPPLRTEVVGFKDGAVFLMPLGEALGIGPESEVIPTGKPFSIKCGYGLLGRTLGGVGDPIDGLTPLDEIEGLVDWAVERECPDPYTRQPVDRVISFGVRAWDGLLTVGRGQRVGLCAGSGVGKSTLLGQIARQC